MLPNLEVLVAYLAEVYVDRKEIECDVTFETAFMKSKICQITLAIGESYLWTKLNK